MRANAYRQFLGKRMEKALLTAAILILPTAILAIGLKMRGRQVQWTPLLWAGFACLVYFLLLRSRDVIPNPAFMDALDFNWLGKTLSIIGTMAMLYFLPGVSFNAAGLTWSQNRGSLKPAILTGAVVIIVTTGSAYLFTHTPDTSPEHLLWQSTMPGIDEELFFRGLLLLLLSS